MVAVSVWADKSNENKEEVVVIIARAHEEQAVPREAVTVNTCEALKPTGQTVDIGVQRSTQIVSLSGMRDKDRIQTRWTS